MKNYFLLLTLLCLSLSARAHDAEVDGIFYNLDAANNTATVTFMGDDPLSYDEYYGDVVIPETVTYNDITYSVTSLGYECFRSCSSLTAITIPNSVTSLGDWCFADCSSLTAITIPNTVTSLGYECFYNCSSIEQMVVDAANPVYDSREDCNAIIHTSTNELIVGCKNSHIPNSVTSLGFDCFGGCSSLTSITIPNSVTSLGARCFFYCSSLTAITIPNSVTSLGYECFSNCSSLERMVVDAANPVYDSREDCNAIIHTSTNELIAGCKNSHIPNSVTSLGDDCFGGCSSLTAITIPNSVKSLGDHCFFGCSSLTAITIPNSVKSLGFGCFWVCSSLTSITIPNSVTSLGVWCFSGCSSLTAITIPNSVKSLGDGCFRDCSSLTAITIPNSVTSLGEWCFAHCSSLTAITIPNSVTSLGTGCFSECSSLERMVVDAANPVYDSREDCNAIIHTSTNELIAGCKNSHIPNSVTSLGDDCFNGCRGLTAITIPNSVTSVGSYCFYSCRSLTSITIPNSVTTLGRSCFAWCSSLTAITMLPSTPPSTEYRIFDNTPLETVYVVDEDAKTAYQAQAPWSEYEIVVMPTYNVSWKVNGEPYAIGNPSTSVKVGQSVTVLPSDPDAIGTKVFVGWTDAEIAAAQPTAPDVLFTTPEDAPAVTGNVTYYAVFAVATGSEVWEEISAAPEPGTYAILSDSHFMKASISSNRFANGEATPEISATSPATLTTAPASDCIWEITKPDDYYRMANGSQYAGGTSEKNQGALLDDATDNLAKWTIEHNGSQFSVINYGRSIASVDNAYQYLRENATNGWACYTSDTGSAPRLFKKIGGTVLSDYCTTFPDVQLSVGATGYATLYYSNYDLVVPENTEAYTFRSENGALTESETYAEGTVIPAGEAVVVHTTNDVPCTLNFKQGIATVDCDANSQLAGTDEETVITPDADYYFYGLSLNSSNDINSVGFYWMVADGAAFTNGAHKAYLKIRKSEFAGTQSVRGFAFKDTTTGVESVESSNNAPQAIYDLTGRRVSKAEKGIYIINGKKVIK